jgi:hypothetical protein
VRVLAAAFLLWVGVLNAQERLAPAENPLAQLKEEVKRVLGEAQLPFSDEQEKRIVLMMEDRRRASEDLFGDLMDFRAGPTRGEDSDRVRSAIDWMRSEFLSSLQDYLTGEQLSVWKRYIENNIRREAAAVPAERQPVPQQQQNQTQYVRINNNAFTAEDNGYRFSGRSGATVAPPTEVIQRGGNGAFHGNAQVLLKDDALNAGRRFASNKPPYQERQITVDAGGPIIPGRLTTNIAFNHSEAENVDTIHATLPDRIFALGITRPAASHSLNVRNTYQLSNAHSLSVNAGYLTNTSKNQGIGGFVMPERAWDSNGNSWNFELRQFSSLSPSIIYETRFNWSGTRDKSIPATEGLRINVLDAFSSGGAQNRTENRNQNYDFSNLYTRLGEKVTVKAGAAVTYRKLRSFSANNFAGTFTFSSLDAYREGRPINYRVNRGDPLIELNQLELSLFFQNDVKLSPRFTLMYGARYEVQTNLTDRNNFDPRLGFAYGIGRGTVIRGGVGFFHQRVLLNILADQRRLSGQQYEIIVDNPSYPDALQSGAIRNPSLRVTDPHLVTPYSSVIMLSYERTFASTLFFSAVYDRVREIHRARLHNLNAPRDITSPRPSSCASGQSKETCVRPQPDRGNILNLEPSGGELDDSLRLNFRGRFSIFNLSLGYTFQDNRLDTAPGINFGNTSITAGFAPDGLNSDQYNFKADWAHSVQPLHTFNTSVNARLPIGIFLTGTMSKGTHRTYSIMTGKDDNQDTTVNDRPAGLPRNTGVYPGTITFNFNISKAFFFGTANGNGATRTNINLFANITNAFNHPNYAAPSGIMTSPNFGKSTSAGDPREIEAGLRFQF